MDFKVGHGYDVHKLVKNRKLILGGVDIPFEKGLLGHSDADVLVHSIIDSILGAIKLGDIGTLFPDTDNNFLDISSLELLKQVALILKQKGYSIGNIDSTIVAQKPKLKPYVAQMEENIANCLNINIDKINIKATTEEGLGFTGNLEGISANAVCLIKTL